MTLPLPLTQRAQGYFSGTYNAISGKIRRGNTETGEVSGKWSALMEYKSSKVRVCVRRPT